MLEWLGDLTVFRMTGFAAVVIGLLGVILPEAVYQGRDGEKYSVLNHFISELGERGVSRWAWIFNLCIFLCGVAVMVATVSLGLGLPGFWAKLGLLFGVVTGVGMMMIGIFPMDNIKPHATAAVTFFRGGLLMVSAFSLAIFLTVSPKNRSWSRWTGVRITSGALRTFVASSLPPSPISKIPARHPLFAKISTARKVMISK